MFYPSTSVHGRRVETQFGPSFSLCLSQVLLCSPEFSIHSIQFYMVCILVLSLYNVCWWFFVLYVALSVSVCSLTVLSVVVFLILSLAGFTSCLFLGYLFSILSVKLFPGMRLIYFISFIAIFLIVLASMVQVRHW